MSALACEHERPGSGEAICAHLRAGREPWLLIDDTLVRWRT
jgi:hypothetical protein